MATNNFSSLINDDHGIDLIELYRFFQRRWKVIFATTALGLGLILLKLLLTTPLYTATTEIILDPRQKKVVDSDAVLSGLGNDAVTIASEVRIIKSSGIAKRVIKTLNLASDPEFGGQKSASLSLVSTLLGWVGFSQADAEVKDERGASQVQQNKTLSNEAIEKFSKNLDVRRISRSLVIAISYTSNDPKKSAKIANQISEAYLLDQLEAKFLATRRANTWLRGRLAKLQKAVQESEKAVELYKARYNLIGPKGKTLDDAQLEKLNSELILARVQMKERLAKFEQAQDIIKSKGKLSSIDVVAKSDVVKKLREDMAKVTGSISELESRFTKRHPKVLSKRAELRDLHRQIEHEARRIVDNIDNEYQIARRRVASIEEGVGDLRNRTKGARAASIRLRELEREAFANRAIYEAFLGRFKETTQQETLRTADSRVITKAVTPDFPSSPKKGQTILLAFVGFSALGIGFAYLLEYLDDSFKTGEQVEEQLKVAHLVSVPVLFPGDLKQEGITVPIDRYSVMKPLSAYTEAIRTLKVGVELSNIDSPPQVILITSSLPNEGKTTISANLGQLAAQAGTKTLLIDGDLRNPSLSKKWLQQPGPGLIEVLGNQVIKEEAIIRDNTGVEFLQTQNVPYNSAEILSSASMKSLLRDLRQIYGLIIIDASPLLPVVDAKVLVECVDAVVLVVEWDKTPRDDVQTALKLLKAPPEKMAGIVLNKMDMKRISSYGKGSYGRYYKNYPHYYGTTE